MRANLAIFLFYVDIILRIRREDSSKTDIREVDDGNGRWTQHPRDHARQQI
jgi:hypothetical protein